MIVKAMLGGYFTVPVYDVDGKLIPQIDPETGERLRDSQGRPLFQTADAYQEPDHAFAAKILARRNPKDWADASRPSLDEELDKVEAEQNKPPALTHRSWDISLFEKAVQILLDQGAGIRLPDRQLEEIAARQLARRELETKSATLQLPAPQSAGDANFKPADEHSSAPSAPDDKKGGEGK